MTINELKVLIDTAIDLGHGEGRLHLNDSRDGYESFPEAKARLKKCGTQQNPGVMLIVGYK